MKVLVIGGYGGFGARVVSRLAAAGHTVIVAGRSLERAERYSAGRDRLIPLRIDGNDALREALAEHRPAALVDAAGPFQAMSHERIEACLAAGVDYLDLADSRAFVAGVGRFDEAARERGQTVIVGASSVPALSGAVVRHLAMGLDRVSAIEISISASNRATAGLSVARAILGQLGQKFILWRGGEWRAVTGWSETRHRTFRVAGVRPVLKRSVSLADVPDLQLLPDRVAGRPATAFRAGTELAVHNLFLRIGAWLVRRRLVRSIEPAARLLRAIPALTRGAGSDRSAMEVRLFGWAKGHRLERRWTLIAEDGDGPEIPALAAPLLIDRLERGRLAPGARDAGLELDLADFEPAFAALAIRHETVEIPLRLPLYERLFGERFLALPRSVQAMHGHLRDGSAEGRASVTRGRHSIARCIGWLMRFPPAGEHCLTVHFEERAGGERWTRDFSGHQFHSNLSLHNGRLVERFGPLRFAFDLPCGAHGLEMVMRRWSIGPIPLPLALAPRSLAREWDEDGRFQFDVPISLPLIGTVVRYRGWLVPREALTPPRTPASRRRPS